MPNFTSRTGALAVADIAVPRTPNAAALVKSDPGLAVSIFYQPALCQLVDPTAVNAAAQPLPAPPLLGNGAPLFQPIPRPRPGDWLAEREEKGQSVLSYLRGQFRARPHGTFNTIVVVILGKQFAVPHLPELQEYCAAFFQCRIRIIGPVDIESNAALRHRPTEWCARQYICSELMQVASDAVTRERDLSRSALVHIGVTMYDITPDFERYNFVYGQASLADGRGVFSLCRFQPGPEARMSDAQRSFAVFKSAAKVVVHELMHMIGLRHCINHVCNINGANHAGELERQPLVECPNCTAKLLCAFGWDLRRRYADLAAVGAKVGFADEAVIWAALARYYTAFHDGTTGTAATAAPTAAAAAAAAATSKAVANASPAATAAAVTAAAAASAPAAANPRRPPAQMGTLYNM